MQISLSTKWTEDEIKYMFNFVNQVGVLNMTWSQWQKCALGVNATFDKSRSGMHFHPLLFIF